MPRPRIVSLLASATEIACALGFEDALVGRSHECDYPPSVERLPVCSEPKIDVEGSSREIDERVKRTAAEGLSIYRVDAAMLRELRPDVILTQDHCEVCAVSLRDVQEAVCELIDARAEIVSLSPNSLEDVWESIRRVGKALGASERAERLVETLTGRLESIRERACSASRTLTASGTLRRPTVVCLEWLDPLMAAGNWMPALVEVTGGRSLLGAPDRHSPWTTWEELQAADPDYILTMPCGWDIAKSGRELAALEQRPEWGRLRAVRQGRVYLTDGKAYFNRPGPRLVESAEILAEILLPGEFDFGHEGTGWEVVSGG